MAAETIIVEIDPAQLSAQKANGYSLFLAKKVNGEFTVIWQSLGPYASVGHPSYEPKNNFTITIPAYQVNYGNLAQQDGAVSFTSGGIPVTIEVGQTVALDAAGLFGTPDNGGTAGSIIVNNSLAGNPHEALYDNNGNPVFVNVDSGMDIGGATLTPIDEYQVWFDNQQETGTIIAHNVSNAGIVTFSGADTVKTISYNVNGAWQDGGLTDKANDADLNTEAGEIAVIVAATFTKALSIAAATYLMTTLFNKFGSGLRPKTLAAGAGSFWFEATFKSTRRFIPAILQQDEYEKTVSKALAAAASDPASGLRDEAWTLSETRVSVSY